jgi:hypothetical protein
LAVSNGPGTPFRPEVVVCKADLFDEGLVRPSPAREDTDGYGRQVDHVVAAQERLLRARPEQEQGRADSAPSDDVPPGPAHGALARCTIYETESSSLTRPVQQDPLDLDIR